MNNKLTLEGIEYELVPTSELTFSSKPGHPPIIIIESKMFLAKAVVDKQVSPEAEKEWEVISFQHNNLTFHKDGEKYRATMPLASLTSQTTDNPYLNHLPKSATILSVKRLTDGEVFFIGDYVNIINAHKITRIIIGGAPQNHERNENLVWLSTSDAPYYHGVDLMVATKYKPKPIFKTNDGVEYFEGQESDGLCGLNIATWGTTVAMVRFALTDYNNDWVFFSSKLQLANYIRKKKPTISYDDVIMFLDAIKMEIPAQHLASFIKMIESKL